ncbi:MAG TPA: LysR substrate-binding domain-containing protein [Gemmatimonadaceae bacterium]|nr:LysR substrate-binding domain-containing protein [Gemmatimonadaceae bacterium]
MTLNLNALRVFAAVVERGGFTRASAALHLSQPAVSKAVLGLERQVGLPLLERGPRAVRVTEAGAALYERARELFAVERTAEDELRALRGLEGGALRVGASTTVATYLLPPILGAFQARHPRVALHVTSGNTRAVARALLGRRLDVALVEGPVDDARLTVEPWRDDELVVIAPPDHPLAVSRRAVPLAALAAEPFVFRERGSGTRAVTEAAFAAHDIRLRVALTLDSTEAVKQAVAAGLGLAAVSRAAAADQLALGCVRAVRATGLVIRRRLTLLRLTGRRPGAPARAFEALLGAGGERPTR